MLDDLASLLPSVVRKKCTWLYGSKTQGAVKAIIFISLGCCKKSDVHSLGCVWCRSPACFLIMGLWFASLYTVLIAHWWQCCEEKEEMTSAMATEAGKAVAVPSPVYFFIHSFIWLCQVLVAALGSLIFVAACRIFLLWHVGYSSPARGWTYAPCIGSSECLPLDFQGSPSPPFWMRNRGYISLLLLSTGIEEKQREQNDAEGGMHRSR